MTPSDTPICMIFDAETGNAIDSFDYTVEELERRLSELRGDSVVTMEPSQIARLG